MNSDFHLNGMYRFGAELEYEIRIARDIRDRKAAWGFVRRAYVREGYAQESGPDLWYGIHDALPATTTFAVKRAGVIVATLTLVFDSAIGLPADGLYGAELDERRARNRRLCEIVSLASEERRSVSGMKVIRHLFRLAYLVARDLEEYTDFMITVNPSHAAYYQKSLLFEQIGPERAYDKVAGAPAEEVGALGLAPAPSLSGAWRPRTSGFESGVLVDR